MRLLYYDFNLNPLCPVLELGLLVPLGVHLDAGSNSSFDRTDLHRKLENDEGALAALAGIGQFGEGSSPR